MVANGLQTKYRYWIFCKFEGENFGNWPSIHHCFPPYDTLQSVDYWMFIWTYIICGHEILLYKPLPFLRVLSRIVKTEHNRILKYICTYTSTYFNISRLHNIYKSILYEYKDVYICMFTWPGHRQCSTHHSGYYVRSCKSFSLS